MSALRNVAIALFLLCFVFTVAHSQRTVIQFQQHPFINYTTCPFPSHCNITDTSALLCNSGYIGTMCNTCSSGFYRIGNTCHACSNVDTSRFLIFLLCFSVLLLFFVYIPIFGFVVHYFATFMIWLQFIQITNLFVGFGLDWPASLNSTFEYLSWFNFNMEVFQLECIGLQWSLYAKLMFQLFVPLIYIITPILPIVIASLVTCIAKLLNRKPLFIVIEFCLSSFGGAALCMYIMLTTYSLAVFSCEPHQGTNLYDSNIICQFTTSPPDYIVFGVFSFIAQVLYVIGIPLVVCLFVIGIGIANRAVYEKQKKEGEEVPAKITEWKGAVHETNDHIIRLFGTLYYRYKANFYWWELLVILRKFLLVIIFTFLKLYPVYAVTLASGIVLISCIITAAAKPYKHVLANVLEPILQFLQYIMLVGGLCFFASKYYGVPLAMQYESIIEFIVFLAFFLGVVLGAAFMVAELIWLIVDTARKRKVYLSQSEDDDSLQQTISETRSKHKKNSNLESPLHGEELVEEASTPYKAAPSARSYAPRALPQAPAVPYQQESYYEPPEVTQYEQQEQYYEEPQESYYEPPSSSGAPPPPPPPPMPTTTIKAPTSLTMNKRTETSSSDDSRGRGDTLKRNIMNKFAAQRREEEEDEEPETYTEFSLAPNQRANMANRVAQLDRFK